MMIIDCYDNDECSVPLKQRAGPNVSILDLQLEYNRWQVELAHSLDLAISLKNTLQLIPQLVDLYDFAVNEQCYQYNECNVYAPFTQQGKAVLNFEYKLLNCANTRAGIRTKHCDGFASEGICRGTVQWRNCFADTPTPLPPVEEVGGSSRPTSSPTLKPTSSPTVSPTTRPTASPIEYPPRILIPSRPSFALFA